jgi:hypothetical protein
MLSLEQYRKEYGTCLPQISYSKDFLEKQFFQIKTRKVEEGRCLFPLEEEGLFFYNYIIKSKTSHYPFVYSFFPNYFEVSTKKFEPIVNVFKEDCRLKKSIDMYNKYYGNKKEFDITLFIKCVSMSSNIYKAANFPPIIARYIYDKFTKSGETVFDFSAGFGGRMLGAMSSNKKINYVGIDPHPKTFKGLCDLYDFFQLNSDTFSYNTCVLYNSNIEDFNVPNNLRSNVSLCFSSPPFYDLELYTHKDSLCSKTQASYMYTNKETFMEGFFGAVTSKSYELLKDDGLLIINIKDSIRKKTVSSFLKYMKTTKFEEIKDSHILMYTKNMTHATSLGKNVRKEPIFVFRKVV